MTYRQDLDALLRANGVTPSGVLDENIIKALVAGYILIAELEERIETLEAGTD